MAAARIRLCRASSNASSIEEKTPTSHARDFAEGVAADDRQRQPAFGTHEVAGEELASGISQARLGERDAGAFSLPHLPGNPRSDVLYLADSLLENPSRASP